MSIKYSSSSELRSFLINTLGKIINLLRLTCLKLQDTVRKYIFITYLEIEKYIKLTRLKKKLIVNQLGVPGGTAMTMNCASNLSS